jgi:hypothetical protein
LPGTGLKRAATARSVCARYPDLSNTRQIAPRPFYGVSPPPFRVSECSLPPGGLERTWSGAKKKPRRYTGGAKGGGLMAGPRRGGGRFTAARRRRGQGRPRGQSGEHTPRPTGAGPYAGRCASRRGPRTSGRARRGPVGAERMLGRGSWHFLSECGAPPHAGPRGVQANLDDTSASHSPAVRSQPIC